MKFVPDCQTFGLPVMEGPPVYITGFMERRRMMIISAPGKVSERITLLGRLESCIYVVDGGNESVLIGGGNTYIVPDLLQQIESFGMEERKIKRLIILHSHFDHCGTIPYLKKRWPWAAVTASSRAKELLGDAKVSQSIATLNHREVEKMGLTDRMREIGFEYTQIDVEEVARDGDVLSVGDLSLEVMEVPGHSSCSMALYMPFEKALFPSDAAGIRHQGYFLASGNSNYDLYQQNLERLAQYEVDLVLSEHYGASTEEDAHFFLPKSIETARKTRLILEETYRRTKDVKKTADEITTLFSKEAPKNFFSPELLSLITGQMVKYFAKKMASN